VRIQINLLYLGSLLHVYVKRVVYFDCKHDFCEIFTFIGNIYDLEGSIVFLINGDARLGFGLLKCDIFKGKSQKRISLISNYVKQKVDIQWYSFSLLVKFGLNPYISSAMLCFKLFGFVLFRH
jgi:hypothetical protein